MNIVAIAYTYFWLKHMTLRCQAVNSTLTTHLVKIYRGCRSCFYMYFGINLPTPVIQNRA